MKKDFKNLKPTKAKPSDEKIDEVLREMNSDKTDKPKKQKLIVLNVKLPENLYNALDAKARTLGLSKKAIVVDALWSKLDTQ